MKIGGVEIKGSEAIFAVVEFDGADLAHLPTSLKKIALEDDDIAANVRQFREQVAAFVGDNGLKMLAIKKRGKKGEFAGGPTTSIAVSQVLRSEKDSLSCRQLPIRRYSAGSAAPSLATDQ